MAPKETAKITLKELIHDRLSELHSLDYKTDEFWDTAVFCLNGLYRMPGLREEDDERFSDKTQLMGMLHDILDHHRDLQEDSNAFIRLNAVEETEAEVERLMAQFEDTVACLQTRAVLAETERQILELIPDLDVIVVAEIKTKTGRPNIDTHGHN
jgi:hypothetical protein